MRNAMVIAVASCALVVDRRRRDGRRRPRVGRARCRSATADAEAWLAEPRSTGTRRRRLDAAARRALRRAAWPAPPRPSTTTAATAAYRRHAVGGPGPPRRSGTALRVSSEREHRSRLTRQRRRARRSTDAWLGESLLYVLRERLGLPGAKNACEQGECGSCSVLVDGELVCACLVLAAAAAGCAVTTVEGLPDPSAASCSPTCSRPSSTRRGAVRLLHAGPRRGRPRPARPVARRRPTWRCARRWPATCAAAPATAGSLAAVRPVVAAPDRRRRPQDRIAVTDGRRRTVTTPAAAGIGDSAARPDGGAEGAGRVRLRVRPLGRGHAVGPRPCARPTRTPASASIDIGPALAHPRRARRAHRRRRPRRHRSTGSSTATSRCSPPTSCATSASRSPSSPPTTPTPPAGRCEAIVVDYEVARPAHRRRGGARRRTPPSTPTATSFRQLRDPPRRPRRPPATVVVEGTYEVGMQDQAFLGPEAGPGHPRRRRRRRPVRRRPSGCTTTATRWPRASACPPEQVRLTLGGVGGAFGAREDVSLHVHACLLALRTGRPVKMMYSAGGVVLRARPPAPGPHLDTATTPTRRRHASSRSRPASLLDGGAYASSSLRRRRQRGAASPPVPTGCPTRSVDAVGGAHQQPAVRGDAGLRRGAGVLRPRGADGQAGRRPAASTRSSCGCATPWRTGDTLLTGQVVTGTAPVAEVHPGLPPRCPLPAPDPADADESAGAARRRGPHRRRRRRAPGRRASRSGSRT